MSKKTPKYTALRGNTYWLHYKIPANIFKYSNLSSQLVRLSLNTRDSIKTGSLAQILIIKLNDFFKSTQIDKISKTNIDEIIINTMVRLGEATNQSIQRKKIAQNH